MSETIESLNKFHKLIVGDGAMEALKEHCYPLPAGIQFSLWGVALSTSALLPSDMLVALDKDNNPVWVGRVGRGSARRT